MFCEGLSLDFTGRIIATGGNTDAATSAYVETANDWTALAVSVAFPSVTYRVPCVMQEAVAKF